MFQSFSFYELCTAFQSSSFYELHNVASVSVSTVIHYCYQLVKWTQQTNSAPTLGLLHNFKLSKTKADCDNQGGLIKKVNVKEKILPAKVEQIKSSYT